MRSCTCSLAILVLSAASGAAGDLPAIPASSADPTVSLTAFLDGRQDADAYVEDKLRRFRIVVIGETHWIHQEVRYFIRTLERAVDLGFRDVALEFGSHRHEAELNAMLRGDAYSEETVRRVLRSVSDIWGFPYREYADIYRRIFDLNRGFPVEDRVRVHLPDDDIWGGDESQARKMAGRRDETMGARLVELAQRGGRVLIYCGAYHGVVDRRRRAAPAPAAALVARRFPTELFSIRFHAPWVEVLPGGPIRRTAHGRIDRALERVERHTVGFDLTPDDPIGSMTLRDYARVPSCRFPERGSSLYDAPLATLWDGYIILDTVDRLRSTAIEEGELTPEWAAEAARRSKLLDSSSPSLGLEETIEAMTTARVRDWHLLEPIDAEPIARTEALSNLGPKEVAHRILDAAIRRDRGALTEWCRGADLTAALEASAVTKILSVGEPFRNTDRFSGVYVPFKVRTANGLRRGRLALQCTAGVDHWVMTGGW